LPLGIPSPKPYPQIDTFKNPFSLIPSRSDIVTVQKLLGHSDIDTTRQYLNPDEDLKRQAVNRLSLAI
jgi:integrase